MVRLLNPTLETLEMLEMLEMLETLEALLLSSWGPVGEHLPARAS